MGLDLEIRATLERPSEQVFDAIFEAENWTTFTGHGMIPAIESVTITPAEERVGTRFDVVNADGSSHVETVTAFTAGRHLALRMDGFSKPLSMFADHFVETWHVDGDDLVRSFALHPRNVLGALMLRLVRPSLRKAAKKQTLGMVQV